MRGRKDMTAKAIAHDEWDDVQCRTFRTVLDVVYGSQWDYAWQRLASGNRFDLATGALSGLVSDADEEKLRLRDQHQSALRNLEVVVDTWSDPGSRRTRFQMDTVIPFEAGWDPLRLQFIQVCKLLGHPEERIGRPISNDDPFMYFVDRGRCSPAYKANGWPCGHPDRPYFYPPRSMRTELTDKSITYFDSPADVDLTREAYFEAVLVEIGLNGTADRVLKVLKYGWVDGGKQRCVESGAGTTFRTDPVIGRPLSNEFRRALSLDYPDFRLT
jgi:hypothetical protein